MGRSRGTRNKKGRNGIMGCMNGMMKFFDFRQGATDPVHISQIKTTSPARPSADNASCSGTEAPRNNLETLPYAKDCLLDKDQHHLVYEDEDIPMGFEIFTRAEVAPKDSINPSMKTKSANVVARLMGIEVLPDETETEGTERLAVNSILTKNQINNKVSHPAEKKLKEVNSELRILEKRCENIMRHESRSLPETPRISWARRSDVDHRLSLQIQKENLPPFININYIDGGPLAASPTSSTSYLRNLDSRRTNYSSNAGNKPTSPRLIFSSNSPRLAKSLMGEDKAEHRHSNSTPSRSPRLRHRSEDGINKTKPRLEKQTSLSSPRSSLRPSRFCSQPLQEQSKSSREAREPRLSNTIKGNKPKFEVTLMKKINGGDVLSRAARKDITPKRIRERYVRVVDENVQKKKGQKPLCDSLVMMKKRGKSVILTTKEPSPRLLRTLVSQAVPSPQYSRAAAPPVTDDHLTQHGPSDHHVHTSSSIMDKSLIPSNHTNRIQLSHPSRKPQPKSLPSSHDISLSSSSSIFMYDYIKTILELMGVRCNSKVSFTHWYSPSHPLDPAIFTKLDAYHHRRRHHHHARHRYDVIMPNTKSNRRLAFEFVDELLRERLKACLTMHVKPWMMMVRKQQGCTMKTITGKQLLDDVWMDARVIPSMNCKIIQDIDALVSNVDTGHHSSAINANNAESVVEAILFQIGQEIAESLVSEAVVEFLSLQSEILSF